MRALVQASFKKLFNSRAVNKQLEARKLAGATKAAPQPTPHQIKLINEIFSNQLSVLIGMIHIFDSEAASIDVRRHPAEKLVSSFIIEHFVSETVNNTRNRFCYLQHLALLHLLSCSLELRQLAKQSNLLGQLLQILNQYMI